MNKQTYDHQKITAYLLGALPETEAEVFDELSFTDDEFADVLKVAEKDLVDAYVHGELERAELEKFKKHYLASPLRLEKVRFAQSFQEYAGKKIAETNAPTAVVEAGESKSFFAGLLTAFRDFFDARSLLPVGFAAAALLLMVFGGWLLVENSRLREQASETERRRDALIERESELQRKLETESAANAETARELARAREERERLETELNREKTEKERIAAEQRRVGQAVAPSTRAPVSPKISVASFVLAAPLRGTGQLQSISIPSRTDFVRMQLELEPNEFASYRVSLTSQAGANVWQSGALKAQGGDDNQTLTIRFPAKLLKSQIYTLTVAGIAPDGKTENFSNYSFRAVLE